MNVLLVEADLQRRRRLQRLIKNAGHGATCFGDGDAALEHFATHRPVIVIAGNGGRGRDGRSLCRRARGLAPMDEAYLILLQGAGRPVVPLQVEVDDFIAEDISVTELRGRLEIARRTLERRHEDARQWKRVVRISSDSPHPILEMTPTGALLHANPSALPLLEAWGWSPGSPLPGPLLSLLRNARSDDDPAPTRLCCAHRYYSFVSLLAEDGNVTLYGHDVTHTEEPARESRPLRPTFDLHPRDTLTGLSHRNLFYDRVEASIARRRGSAERGALVKVNLDNLRQVNDTLGYRVGDQSIQLVAQTLREHLTDEDAICREAGDQFVVWLSSVSLREQVGQLCERLSRLVSARADEDRLGIRVTLSCGFAVYPDDGIDVGVLDQHAQQALAQAKQAGRDCWCDFRSAAGANPLIQGDHLYPRLAEAVTQRQIQVHYHPIMEAGTGRVAGFEALARWYNRELGWISPAQFIPVAEARGLITQVSRQVAGLAFGQLAEWRNAGHEVDLSLNISKRQLIEPGYPEELLSQVGERLIKPEWVMLETTERQAMLHDERCRKNLLELAKAGFRLSLDDFGVGHSSFDMVAELPFSEVKIDMALARKAVQPRGRAVVEAIATMCRELGLASVAEGVEEPDQHEALVALNINRLQGHLFSPPLPGPTTFLFLKGTR